METARSGRPSPRRTATLDPHDYTVAWIAPLEIEAQAALHLLDDRHDGRFPVSRGDDYVFHAGSMRGHNVIIATLPAGQEYGTGSAAALASQVKKFFPNLWFGLLVGVAAGLPDLSRSPPRDIRLGDVLVGLEGDTAGLFAYDLGKEQGHSFEPLRRGYALAVTEPIIRSAIGSIKLKAPYDANEFLPYYETLRDKKHTTGTFADRGQDRDKLYDGMDTLVKRPPRPASERNRCDYGDKHKNKEWQPYAAAMAAAYGKAVLNEIPPRDLGPPGPLKQTVAGIATESNESFHNPCYHIQLARNTRFTGRTAVIDTLEKKLFGQEPCQRIALAGLGGIGKTQIALHLAYRVKEQRPSYSIFWVPLISNNSAQQAYVEIANKLGVQKKDDEDIRELVCRYLSSAKAGKWLFVVDNADDREMVFGSAKGAAGIDIFLPKSEQGSILLTTRARQIAVDFAQADIVDIEEMSREEATQLLEKSLPQTQMMQDGALIVKLLDYLAYLPLAITQAVAYLNWTKAPIHKYLSLLRGAKKNIPQVLGQEFRDNSRYRESRNAVATTWLVSFDRIEKSNVTAVKLLSFISYIEPKAIPQSIMPRPGPQSESVDLEAEDSNTEELESAIGELCGYSFLVRRGDSDIFDMHSLVHIATQAWAMKRDRSAQIGGDTMRHLAAIFPSPDPSNRELWRVYLPHALQLLYKGEGIEAEQCRYHLLSRVGKCLYEDRRFKEAVQCFEEVYEWESKGEFAADNPPLTSMRCLANAYLFDRQIKTATKILEYVVQKEQEILEKTDPVRLASQFDLANAYMSDRRIEEAIPIYEYIVAIRKATLDMRNHERLASEYRLATAYLQSRRVKEGIETLEYVVAIQKETLDEKDHSRLASIHDLALGYHEDRRVKEAIEILEFIVTVRNVTLDEKDHDRLTSEQGLGIAYISDRRIKEAITILEHVVSVRRKTLDLKDHSRITSEHSLAKAYLENRQVIKAIGLFEHVVTARRETLGGNDHFRLQAEQALAGAYIENQQVKVAIEMLEHVVAVREKTLGKRDHSRLMSECLLAKAFLEDGRTKEAIKILENVVFTRKEMVDEKDHELFTSEHLLAKAYLQNGWIKQAIGILEHVTTMRRETLRETDYNRFISESELAKAYLKDGQARKAVDLLENVVAIITQVHAEDDPNRQSSMRLLTRAREQLEAESETSEDDSEPSEWDQEMETGQDDVATLSASVNSLINALDRLHM